MRRHAIELDIHRNPMDNVPQDLRILIPGYIERRGKEVTELFDRLEQNDFISIKDIGHRLKGTGTGYGFPIITEIGRELEVAAAHKDAEEVRESIYDLHFVTECLKRLLKGLRG